MSTEGRRRWHLGTVRLILAALILALLVLFIAENFEAIEVRLIVWRVTTRLAWALLLAAALGFVAGWLLARFRR